MLKRNIKCLRKVAFLVFIAMAVLSLGPGIGSALDPEEKMTNPPEKSVIVTIERKTKRKIFTNQKLFLITKSTKVFATSGRETTFRSLPVPCEAEIYYGPGVRGVPEALKIMIRKILPGARTAFPRPIPE
jgi:hypothetical protein